MELYTAEGIPEHGWNLWCHDGNYCEVKLIIIIIFINLAYIVHLHLAMDCVQLLDFSTAQLMQLCHSCCSELVLMICLSLSSASIP